MFAVFVVCKAHCLARAKKATKWRIDVDGRQHERTPEEWESAVRELAAELFAKAKPRKISTLFEATSAAVAFKELAEKTREARTISIKRRDHLRKGGEPVLNLKTKKPRFTWVNV